MANLEIERKFLVRSRDWGTPVGRSHIEQGYLFIAEDRNLRVRRTDNDFVLTLKVRAHGLARYEIETPIDADQGRLALGKLCIAPPVRKMRHLVDYQGDRWEIDVFEGANAGLIVAEIELRDPAEDFAEPPWLGPEVTSDSRFLNQSLARAPFSGWGVSYAELVADPSAG
jgi:adenylate cyclase